MGTGVADLHQSGATGVRGLKPFGGTAFGLTLSRMPSKTTILRATGQTLLSDDKFVPALAATQPRGAAFDARRVSEDGQ